MNCLKTVNILIQCHFNLIFHKNPLKYLNDFSYKYNNISHTRKSFFPFLTQTRNYPVVTPGAGAGKGGGGGGSVRESGGGLGKYGAAQEEEYFFHKQKEQLRKIKSNVKNEEKAPSQKEDK